LRIDVLTIFPGLFGPFLEESILGAALRRGLLEVAVHDLRDWTRDRHRSVDDAPYGGGPGMVMLAEPLEKALDAVQAAGGGEVIYLSPQGRKLDHAGVMELAGRSAVTLLCGRYEGVDERVREHLVDESLIALEREFGERFVRIHRNCIVARDAVRGFERATATEDDEAHWLVVLEGIPERLPVSRRQWAMVRALVAQS